MHSSNAIEATDHVVTAWCLVRHGANLDTRVDVAVEPVDLHAGIAAHQKSDKCASEDSIAIEVPVIEEPDSSSAQQSVPEEGDQQPEGLPVIPCNHRHSQLRRKFQGTVCMGEHRATDTHEM